MDAVEDLEEDDWNDDDHVLKLGCQSHTRRHKNMCCNVEDIVVDLDFVEESEEEEEIQIVNTAVSLEEFDRDD